jgi:hypothetical protein
MTTNPVFIYRPRSGDRVFAARAPEDAIPAIVTWPGNGCRHVVGGVHLVYEAAESRRWWWDCARRMAGLIVDAVGGVAWDDQGTIHLAVPWLSAAEADRWMLAARAASLHDFRASPRISRELVNAASLALVGMSDIYVPGPPGRERDDRPRVHVGRDDDDRWRVTVTDRDGQCVGVVTAPAAWGPPDAWNPQEETP